MSFHVAERDTTDGLIRDHHRFLLKRLLVQWRFVENETELIDQRLEQIGEEEPEIAEAVARWDTVPGVDLFPLFEGNWART
jgi:hypothetical protein